MPDAKPAADAATILVVDDDAAVCWALEQVLKTQGYVVQVAADAAVARRLLKRQRPDLVITDVRMPGESGLDLLAGLKSEHPSLPVVVIVGISAINPAFVRPMWLEPVGQAMLAISSVMVIVGYFVMMRIADIDL